VRDFVAEYAAGRTPPRLRCNERIAAALLTRRWRWLDAVGTGHAQVVEGPNGRELHRAVDVAKDQSYAQFDAASWPRFPAGWVDQGAV
jgi:tRNA-specific 2-thiouridylase